MKNSEQLLKKYVPNKKVLEIGCVGQSYKFRIHKIIKENNPSYLMGIDIQENGINQGKKLGYNVVLVNIENETIDEKFDVIVMTEVIEHFNNCGLAINNIKKMMKSDSILILTTPNCFARKWIQQLENKKRTNTNIDHVIWFDRQTLDSLFNRFNMKVNYFNDLFHSTIVAIVRKVK